MTIINCALNILALPMGIDANDAYTTEFAVNSINQNVYQEHNFANGGVSRTGNGNSNSMQDTDAHLASAIYSCNLQYASIPDIITCHVTINTASRNPTLKTRSHSSSSAKGISRKEKRKTQNRKFLTKNKKSFRSNQSWKSCLGLRQEKLSMTSTRDSTRSRWSSLLRSWCSSTIFQKMFLIINTNRLTHVIKNSWSTSSFLDLCLRHLSTYFHSIKFDGLANYSQRSPIAINSKNKFGVNEESAEVYNEVGKSLRKIADDFESITEHKKKESSSWSAELTFTTAFMWSASILLIGVTTRIIFHN